MTDSLDQLMQRASEALVKMDYLGCETLCLQALGIARQQTAWSYYARILLPLQEARRQRRMIAAEGTIRLGSAGLETPAVDWLERLQPGCMVVTHPHTADDARALDDAVHQQQCHVEVLYANPASTRGTWTVRSFRGPDVHALLPAPPEAWQHRWLDEHTHLPHAAEDSTIATPADWFLSAAEALGDAALDQVEMGLPSLDRLMQLERALQVARDHEILHQRLGDAARAMR
ncbi:hypothetical protein ACERK3_06905 [Phycisphaerales bacterium AB-hyl4]|uniref:Uncharacterized protein n=1 Tax=Natronomicrosphaera hydrolytica TaxID=3242702 RepID=A0ABV4U359_9BACT